MVFLVLPLWIGLRIRYKHEYFWEVIQISSELNGHVNTSWQVIYTEIWETKWSIIIMALKNWQFFNSKSHWYQVFFNRQIAYMSYMSVVQIKEKESWILEDQIPRMIRVRLLFLHARWGLSTPCSLSRIVIRFLQDYALISTFERNSQIGITLLKIESSGSLFVWLRYSSALSRSVVLQFPNTWTWQIEYAFGCPG